MTKEKDRKIKHAYKDSIFRMLFNDKEKIVDLYNALSDGHYTMDTDVEIVTIDEAIFSNVKNDLAFIIDNKFIVLAEHQSTINLNMPLRMMEYLSREYNRIYSNYSIYSKKLIKIPTPELYVFYNGKEDQPLYQELKLSDAFEMKCDKMTVEVVVQVINVNYDKGAEILKKSKYLASYSEFIYRVETLTKELGNRDEAAESVIFEFTKNKSPIADFLRANGGAVMSFLNQYLTTEEMLKIREEDGKAEGILSVAKKLKEINEPIEKIVKVTGLSKEEVESL